MLLLGTFAGCAAGPEDYDLNGGSLPSLATYKECPGGPNESCDDTAIRLVSQTSPPDASICKQRTEHPTLSLSLLFTPPDRFGLYLEFRKQPGFPEIVHALIVRGTDVYRWDTQSGESYAEMPNTQVGRGLSLRILPFQAAHASNHAVLQNATLDIHWNGPGDHLTGHYVLHERNETFFFPTLPIDDPWGRLIAGYSLTGADFNITFVEMGPEIFWETTGDPVSPYFLPCQY